MKTIIVDIETIGEDWEKMDAHTQELQTRWIKQATTSEEEYQAALEDLKNGLGFSPLTGEIVAIGMCEYESNKQAVYYQAPESAEKDQEIDGVQYRVMDEKTMLARFWEVVKKCDDVVTFNGYCFDVPYLMVRSAIHGIRPSVNLMQNRYLNYYKMPPRHIDLQDQLSFYGAMRKKGSLHMWCRAFGIESPKNGGVTGDDVSALFKQKRYLDIAKYNALDIKATAQLYAKYTQYLQF